MTVTNLTTTSCTNTDLTNGTTYYYVVSALNAGGESANSSQVSATPTNRPPVLVNDSYTVNEDSTSNLAVLVNDSDPDGTPLTLVSVSTTNGTAAPVGTNVVYTPAPNSSGTNSLTYFATDGTVTNSALITVVVQPVNDAPVAYNLSVTIPEDTSTNLVLSAADVDSSSLVYAILSDPAHGGMGVLNTSSGAVTYRPTTNYNGSDGFTFSVFDASLYATGMVSITVLPVNDAPVLASISSQTILAGRTLVVTNSASDADVPAQVLTYSLLSAPAGALIDANSGALTWRPTIAQSPATQAVNVVVSDNGAPVMSATQGFTVTVLQPALPTLDAASITNGRFGFWVAGDVGPDYTIQASTDLVSWASVAALTSPAVPFFWADTNSTTFSSRFYRALLGP